MPRNLRSGMKVKQTRGLRWESSGQGETHEKPDVVWDGSQVERGVKHITQDAIWRASPTERDKASVVWDGRLAERGVEHAAEDVLHSIHGTDKTFEV